MNKGMMGEEKSTLNRRSKYKTQQSAPLTLPEAKV